MIGMVAGAVVLAGFISLGLLLDSRVASDVPVIVLTLAGAYAAWLVGVIVFDAIRGANGSQAREP
ncbi:MAG TPA: hypothetical protein VEL12_16080 [Candidatus Nitrosopolaris sp.]|nr:hypothetical protein [Candidatus Nitrosopolaris sp.]